MISPTLDPKQENEPLAETERLILRFFQPEDENDLHEILGDEETMRFSEPAFHPEQTRRFLADFCIAKHGAIAAVQKETGKVIGYLLFREDSAEVYEMGWFFNRQYWGKGYAQEACRALLHYAFTTCRAHRVFAETIDGDRCVRLMRRLTMKPEGVLRKHIRDNKGNWADMILYGILKEEWQEEAAQKTDACISTFRMEEFFMTFSEFFALVKEKLSQADVSAIHEDVAFQFDITGQEAGTFYVELKGGKLSVEPYDYHDRDARITCSADTLMKIAAGKLDPVAAFTLRKIKVDGKIEKALLLKQLMK